MSNADKLRSRHVKKQKGNVRRQVWYSFTWFNFRINQSTNQPVKLSTRIWVSYLAMQYLKNKHSQTQINHIIHNTTYCNKTLHGRSGVADFIKHVLSMQQIGAVLSIDDEPFLVHNEAVGDRVHRLMSCRHSQIRWKLTVHFVQFLAVNIKTNNFARYYSQAVN